MECYYKWCEHHEKDEPICSNKDMVCTASKFNLQEYELQRTRELELINITRDFWYSGDLRREGYSD